MPVGLDARGALRVAIRAVLLLAAAGGCKESDPVELDVVPPARIADLRVLEISHASVTLAWTASGDDGPDGTATDYDVRVSSQPFDATTWSTADRFVSTLVPASAGTPEALRIPLLLHAHPYYFAIRAQDDFFNESPTSDIAMTATHDFGFAERIGGSFLVPHGIAVDDSGGIYIADTANNLIRKYSSNGGFLRSWGGTGAGLGQFAQPHGVAFGNDVLYVTDTYNHRVQVFARDGTALHVWGEEGEGDGMFRRPVGIAIDPDGNVYVTDVVRERVQRFEPNGRFRAGWGSSGPATGMFRNAIGVAADAAGNVFVLDQSNQPIQVFTRDGQFVRRWGRPGGQNGEFALPSGIALDADGAVYVADESRNDFQKFTSRGGWLGSWSTSQGSARRPSAIAVAPQGSAYVVYVDADFFSVFTSLISPN